MAWKGFAKRTNKNILKRGAQWNSCMLSPNSYYNNECYHSSRMKFSCKSETAEWSPIADLHCHSSLFGGCFNLFEIKIPQQNKSQENNA